MFLVVHASGRTILYFIIPHIAFIIFSVFSLYHTASAPLSHKHVRPETVFVLCFLPSRNETITTGRGLLVLLDEIKPLVSNVISLLISSLG